MKILKKTRLISIVCLLLSSTFSFADDAEQLYQRYEQAKINITYEGEVGYLLQQIAQRLNIGYISYEFDNSQLVRVATDTDSVSIKALMDELTAQLNNSSDIRFQKIGNRLFLILSAKGGEALLPPQELAIQPAPAVSAPAQTQVTEPTIPSADSNANVEAEMPVSQNTATVQNENSNNGMNSEEHSKLLYDIITQTTDDKIIAQYKNKKAPQYKVISKEKLGMDNIRVTPLGTFLVFSDSVDTTKLAVKGEFEAIGQYGNLIGILHKDRNPPQQIDISDENGNKLLIKRISK